MQIVLLDVFISLLKGFQLHIQGSQLDTSWESIYAIYDLLMHNITIWRFYLLEFVFLTEISLCYVDN